MPNPFYKGVNKILVKCRICGSKVEKSAAYKITVDGKNNYYCNKQEYNNWTLKKKTRDNVYNLIYDIFGRKITNTVLYKEIDELGNIYEFDKILAYLQENYEYICMVLEKNFNSEYAKIRYFTAILKNNLADFDFKEVPIVKPIEMDFVQMKFNRKNKRKPLIEYEREYGGERNG